MYNFGILLAIFLLGILKLASGTDYCDPELCSINGVLIPHIGCKHSGKFSDKCIEPSEIEVTPTFQKVILHEHNDLRNKVANGSLIGFESAKRMATMTWDTELAFLAGLNARQCEMAHDECHNTDEYKYSGQNLGLHQETDTIPIADFESNIIELIHEWFSEYKFTSQRDVDMCGRVLVKQEREFGHFTAMIQEKSSKVGCSIVMYKSVIEGEDWSTMLLVCDYSYGNTVDKPIYVKGPQASDCQTGTNSKFKALCSVSENIEPFTELSPEPSEENPLLSKRNSYHPLGSMYTTHRISSRRTRESFFPAKSRTPHLSAYPRQTVHFAQKEEPSSSADTLQSVPPTQAEVPRPLANTQLPAPPSQHRPTWFHRIF